MYQIRDLLRLQAWDFEVVEQPAEDGTMLDVKPDPRTWWARVRVGSFFQTDNVEISNSPKEQRTAVVHELLHLVQADLMHWLQEGVWQKPLAPDLAETIRTRVMEETEKITEFSARLIAETVPLPPDWPE